MTLGSGKPQDTRGAEASVDVQMHVQGLPEGSWLGCWRGQREALVLAAVTVELGGDGSLVKGQGVVLGKQREDLARVSVGPGCLPGRCWWCSSL